jgi:RNA polymerase sigma-70 factor (ECF subfamily)
MAENHHPPDDSEADSPSPTDHSLLENIRQGNQEAAALLYQRYAHRLRGLAQAQCSADLARCVEVEDLVQSVFGSFFRAASQGYYEVPRDEELWSLFLVIALNKIRAKGAYHRAAKRDMRRTVGGPMFEFSLEQVAARDESAQGLLQVTVEDTLSRLPAAHQEVLRLRLEGFEVQEIADKLGRSLRTCERLLQEVRKKLADLLQPEE